MSTRSSFLLVPVLGLLLAFLVQFEPARPGIKKKKRGAGATPAVARVGGPWSNQRFLDDGLEEASAWSKAATKADFVTPPTVRPSDPDTAAAFLFEDLQATFKKLGAKTADEARTMARQLADQVVAAYDPKENVIHVLPSNAVRMAGEANDPSLIAPEVLKLVLVRMATIAMDRQLYPEWKEALDNAEGLDQIHVAGAVLEGHAQYAAQRVAERWVNTEEFPEDGFERLTRLLTVPHAGAGAFGSEATFAIVKGHAFMKRAARKRGGAAKALKTPPKTRNDIFDPDSYFKRPRKPSALPGKIFAAFESLFVAPGQVPVSAQHDVGSVALLLQPMEKTKAAAVLASFKSAQRWTATNGEISSELWLVEFRAGALANAFVSLAREASKERGGDPQEGAGRDNGLPGFSGTEERGEDDDKQTWFQQFTSEGKFVLGLRTTADLTEYEKREPWDDAVEAATEVLAKAQKSRTNKRRERRGR